MKVTPISVRRLSSPRPRMDNLYAELYSTGLVLVAHTRESDEWASKYSPSSGGVYVEYTLSEPDLR